MAVSAGRENPKPLLLPEFFCPSCYQFHRVTEHDGYHRPPFPFCIVVAHISNSTGASGVALRDSIQLARESLSTGMKPYWQRLIDSTGMGAVGEFQRFQCVGALF